jgi:hypothetical protein
MRCQRCGWPIMKLTTGWAHVPDGRLSIANPPCSMATPAPGGSRWANRLGALLGVAYIGGGVLIVALVVLGILAAALRG